MRILLCALATLFALAVSMPAHARPNVTGLDRANQVAGDEHGQQGRDNAAFHQATQNGSVTIFDSPTTVPGGNPSTVPVPEPTSLVLLTSGLVGLWFVRLRRKS